MERIFLPTLHTFAMDNVFTGSFENFRFRVQPQVIMATPKEVDFEQSTMYACYWYGPLCYEKSTVEGENTFPLTEAGREEMLQWLDSKIDCK